MNFSNLPPSESGPHFGMDQYSSLLDMSNTPSLPAAYPALPTSPNQDMTASVDSMPMSSTPLLPAAYPAPPTLPNQNNTTSTPASNNGFIVSNKDYSVLNNAIHTLAGISAGTRNENGKSKKRKTYEEQNAHCILPDGSHHEHKKGHRTEAARDENVSGPKKQNVNKKGKGSKGKK